MMRITDVYKRGLVLSLALPLLACSSLIARLDGARIDAADPAAGVGIAYYLPAKVLDADIEFQINACEEPAGADKLPKLAFSIRHVFTEQMVPDFNWRYTIRYEELNALTKVTDAKFAILPNGMLGSVNASIDDRTGAILGNVIDVGTKLVRGALLTSVGVPPVGISQITELMTIQGQLRGKLEFERSRRSPNQKEIQRLEEELARLSTRIADAEARITATEKLLGIKADGTPAGMCSPRLLARLQKVKSLQQQIAEDDDKEKQRARQRVKLAAAAAELSDIRKALRQLKADKGTDLEIKEKVDEEQKAAAALKAVGEELDKLGDGAGAKLRAQLLAAQAENSYHVRALITPDSSKAETSVWAEMSTDTLAQIFSPAGYAAVTAVANCPDHGWTESCRFSWPGTELRLAVFSAATSGAGMVAGSRGAQNAASAAREKVDPPVGIHYRQPAYAELLACAGRCPARGGAAHHLLSRTLVAVPQYGVVSVLTLQNRLFDNNTLNAVFSADGGLSSLSFNSKARAEAASAAAAAGADKYFNFVKDSIRDARDERKAQQDDQKAGEEAQLSSYKSRLESLKVLRDIELKRTGVTGSAAAETERLSAEAARLQQEIEVVKLRKELETLRAGGSR